MQDVLVHLAEELVELLGVLGELVALLHK